MDMQKVIKQGLVEEIYSKRNIKDTVTKGILVDNSSLKTKLYEKCTAAILTWLIEPSSYDSKQARKDHIKRLDSRETVTGLFVTVCTGGTEPIQAKVTKLATYLGFSDVWEGITAAGELLGVCVDTGLYDAEFATHMESMSIVPLISLDQEIEDFIEKTKYLPPMQCEPRNWPVGDASSKSNRNIGGGQLTLCDHVVLGAENNHGEYQEVTSLNIMQRVPLSIDEYMLEFIEEPKEPHANRDAKDQFNQMIEESNEVYKEILGNGNVFYNIQKFDFRGRCYSVGHHLHIQASEYKKSLINLAHKELIV